MLLICSCLTHCRSIQRHLGAENDPPWVGRRELGPITRRGIWIPYCSDPHFSRHDSDKQKNSEGGLAKCQRMTMRLLKLQPAICRRIRPVFFPSSMEECRDYSREIDTSLTVICLSSASHLLLKGKEHVWLSWPERTLPRFTSVGVNTVAPDTSWEHIRHSWTSLRPAAQRANRPPAEVGKHERQALEWE